ncbi:MAG: hypothetical protein AB8B91_12960 [Rubripirellula sp.]
MVERVSVSGKVFLDGQPLVAGAVVFRSDARAPDGTAVTAFGFVENGEYAIDLADGPAVGSSRVEFRSKPRQREQLEDEMDQAARKRSRRPTQMSVVEIPEKYGSDSPLRVEIRQGENRHNFELETQQ